MTTLRLAIGLFILAAASTAIAMHVTNSIVPLGWSSDGTAVLLQIVGHGPEGGGDTRLLLLEANGASLDALVSDDMSPGDGSRPQRVSPEKCAEVTKPLAARVAELGFANVTPGKGGCSLVAKSEVGGELKVKMSGGQALVFAGDKPVVHAAAADYEAVSAWASPNGRSVVMLRNVGLPVLAYFTGPGKLASLAPVTKKNP